MALTTVDDLLHVDGGLARWRERRAALHFRKLSKESLDNYRKAASPIAGGEAQEEAHPHRTSGPTAGSASSRTGASRGD